MRLAIESFPFLGYSHKGPKVFLGRLTDSIRKQKLCDIRPPFIPNYDIALFAIENKSIFHRPYVIRVDGLYFDTENTVGSTEEMNRVIFEGIKGSSGVVFVSEFSRIMVERFHKPSTVPTMIIHNKVPLDLFSPRGTNMRSRLGIGVDERVLVTSAHWRRHKRLEETIKLVNLLRAKDKHHYKLVVLGQKPKNIPQTEGVIFCGEIKPNELPSWYRAADIYVHLAWIEPCGNSQIEAMACGLPVVCTNNGGIGETVAAAGGGIVSTSDNPYKYTKLNYYSPPEPDYSALIRDIKTIFSHLDYFRDNIIRTSLDIDVGAKQYVDFISRIYSGLDQ